LKPFETIEGQSSNEIRGTGLGLSITRMLVELHEGALTLRSVEGEGTTAEFTLPRAAVKPNIESKEHEAKNYEQQALSSNSVPINIDENTSVISPEFHNCLTKNALIFYADDEEVNRELVASQLLDAGYQIKVFPNGQALLDSLPQSSPELILLDWMMPGKNGLDVCKEIREQFDAYTLPIIMLTARHQINDIVQALNAGANDYLTKPYHEQELTARVYSQVSVKRLLLASLENKQLKSEIQHQKQQKQQLNFSNLRLTNALDASQENILLLNEDLDIIFVNTGASTLLGIEDAELSNFDQSDITITHYIAEASTNQLREHLNSNQVLRKLSIKLNTQSNSINASIQTIDSENERFLTLILHNIDTKTSTNTHELLSSLSLELSENRQRMEQIESTLIQLNTKDESNELEVNTHLPDSDPKELVVKALRTTLITWERYTHKTKADLAEESHCWRVYVDGATAKTRTLDKYLSVKTLPAKPRWRAVIKTANYVLDHCSLSEEDQQDLNELIQKVNEAYS